MLTHVLNVGIRVYACKAGFFLTVRLCVNFSLSLSYLSHCSCPLSPEGRRRLQAGGEASSPTGSNSSSSSKKENYIIIVDERKIKVTIYYDVIITVVCEWC